MVEAIESQLILRALEYGIAGLAFIALIIVIGFTAVQAKRAHERDTQENSLQASQIELQAKMLIADDNRREDHRRYSERMTELQAQMTLRLESASDALVSILSVLESIHDDTKHLPDGLHRISRMDATITELKKTITDGIAGVQRLLDSKDEQQEQLVQRVETALAQLETRIETALTEIKRQTGEHPSVEASA